MNFRKKLDDINVEFCNAQYADYLKRQWGIAVGYKPTPTHISIMRKRLADWQNSYDCNNALCTISKGQDIVVVSYGLQGSTSECMLNPPLISSTPFHHLIFLNRVREILVSVFRK